MITQKELITEILEKKEILTTKEFNKLSPTEQQLQASIIAGAIFRDLAIAYQKQRNKYTISTTIIALLFFSREIITAVSNWF